MEGKRICWRLPEELIRYDEPVLCWTYNGKCLTFKETGSREHWIHLTNKYGARYWTYQRDVGPEEVALIKIKAIGPNLLNPKTRSARILVYDFPEGISSRYTITGVPVDSTITFIPESGKDPYRVVPDSENHFVIPENGDIYINGYLPLDNVCLTATWEGDRDGEFEKYEEKDFYPSVDGEPLAAGESYDTTTGERKLIDVEETKTLVTTGGECEVPTGMVEMEGVPEVTEEMVAAMPPFFYEDKLIEYIKNERNKVGFLCQGKEVSWNQLSYWTRKHDYPYYFSKKILNGMLDCFPFKVS